MDYELESEEDEETLLERRRQKRLAIVAKYAGSNQVGVSAINDTVVVIVTSIRCICDSKHNNLNCYHSDRPL